MLIPTETYTELVTNTPHIGFELTWEVITAALGYPLGRWVQRRHDRKHEADRQALADRVAQLEKQLRQEVAA